MITILAITLVVLIASAVVVVILSRRKIRGQCMRCHRAPATMIHGNKGVCLECAYELHT